MQNQLKTIVANRVTRLQDNEYQLAYLRTEEKTENALVEFIENWRKPFMEGRMANLGSAMFASTEVWTEIANASDKAARAELLKSSSEFEELTELEKQAEELRQRAAAKEAALTALWREYSGIPDNIASATSKLDWITGELKKLDPDAARAEYKRHYRAEVDGTANVDPIAQSILAAAIVTVDLKREVLTEKAGDLEARLVELRRRSKELSKRLGRK
jgi:hypothetical protein